MRHAVAAERGSEWPDDTVRPLTPDGAAKGRGTYAVKDNRLVVRPEDDEVLEFACRLVDANTLELTGDDGQGLRFQRQGKVEPPDAPDTPEKDAPEKDGRKWRNYEKLAPDRRGLAKASAGHILYVRYEPVRVVGGGLNETLPVSKIFIMTGGGPGTSTQTLPIFLYRAGFQDFNMGFSAATGVVMLVIVTVVSSFYVRRIHAAGG